VYLTFEKTALLRNSCKTPKPAKFLGPVQAQGIRSFSDPSVSERVSEVKCVSECMRGIVCIEAAHEWTNRTVAVHERRLSTFCIAR